MFPTPRSWAWLLLSVSGVAACNDLPKIPLDSSSAAGAGGVGEGGGSPPTDDSSYASESAVGECVPGQTRCHGQLGFQRCTPNGSWGSSQTCGGYSETGTSSYCAIVDEGGGPWAACIDPACWWWMEHGADLSEGRVGVCTGASEIRRCGPSSLGSPQACAGSCRAVADLDGRALGVCEEACTSGERECLAGPLYRECTDGSWRVSTCPDDLECLPSGDGPHFDIRCGGACTPGTSRCGADGAAVESCSDAGVWEPITACAVGRCVASGPQAQCQAECRPGEHACAFDGVAEARVCGDDGRWAPPATCEEGSLCRIGTAGALGCLACVGPMQRGGNAWGVADSRCAEDGVETCEGDDSYAPAEACAGECVEIQRGASRLAYCK
jgi:hypothetical protein